METALYILHIIVCLTILPAILLQSGKGGGVSAVFGGGGGGTVFGSRGASTFLTRLTSVSAVIFMCTSMGLSWFSSKSRSVLGDLKDAPPPPAQSAGASSGGEADPEAPAAVPAPGEDAPEDGSEGKLGAPTEVPEGTDVDAPSDPTEPTGGAAMEPGSGEDPKTPPVPSDAAAMEPESGAPPNAP